MLLFFKLFSFKKSAITSSSLDNAHQTNNIEHTFKNYFVHKNKEKVLPAQKIEAVAVISGRS